MTRTPTNDIYLKARGLFGTITGLTANPAEAADIIMIMHLLLYMNYGGEDIDVDVMLDHYVKFFKKNYQIQMDAHASEREKMN